MGGLIHDPAALLAEKYPRVPFELEAPWILDRSGRFGEVMNLLGLPEIEKPIPRLSNSQCSYYTDRALWISSFKLMDYNRQ